MLIGTPHPCHRDHGRTSSWQPSARHGRMPRMPLRRSDDRNQGSPTNKFKIIDICSS